MEKDPMLEAATELLENPEVVELKEEAKVETTEQVVATEQPQEKPTNIWLQFNTVSVGWTEDGKPRATYDIVELMNGLIALGHAVSVQFPEPKPEEAPVEDATDDIDEVKNS